MRSHFLRFPAAMLACLLLPVSVRAGTFQFYLMSKTASGVSVHVTMSGLSSPCAGTVCRERVFTIRISPCPPGQSCMNGTYEFTTTSVQFDIALDPGVTYAFEGTYVQRSSNQNFPPCVFTCRHEEDLGPSVYQAPAASTWDVSVVSTHGDTVLVDVGLANSSVEESGCAQEALCSQNNYRTYKMTPCPLAIVGDYVENYCTGGSMTYQVPSAVPRRFALQAGVTYAISGSALMVGLYASQCNGPVPVCDYMETPANRTFSFTPTATEHTTWGQIKALYRGE